MRFAAAVLGDGPGRLAAELQQRVRDAHRESTNRNTADRVEAASVGNRTAEDIELGVEPTHLDGQADGARAVGIHHASDDAAESNKFQRRLRDLIRYRQHDRIPGAGAKTILRVPRRDDVSAKDETIRSERPIE